MKIPKELVKGMATGWAGPNIIVILMSISTDGITLGLGWLISQIVVTIIIGSLWLFTED